MKKTILSIFILGHLWVYSQQTQFNFWHYSGLTPNYGNTVFAYDSEYYIIGIEANTQNTGYTNIWKYDSLGNYLWKKTYQTEEYIDGLNENSCIRDGSNYIACRTEKYYPSSPDGYAIKLYKFDENFDTLWTKKYLQDHKIKIAKSVTVCSDGGYSIAGLSVREPSVQESLNNHKAFILRTDSMGNMLWYKTYGTLDYHDQFFKIIQTPDDGFLCGGKTQSYNNHNWDWYLVKVDSIGNEQWHTTYGNTSFDDSKICDIIMTSDNSYIIAGSLGFNNQYDNQKPYIIKLDEDFVLENSQILSSPSNINSINQIKEIENNQLIAIGLCSMFQPPGIEIFTTLRKFDFELNELLYAEYNTDIQDTYYQGILFNNLMSVDTCIDGGYILGGRCRSEPCNAMGVSLIKTDSMGCDGTGWWDCSTNVTIKEFASNPQFYMYPNPAKDYVVIASSSLSVVEGKDEGSILKIYNLSGQLVKQTVIAMSELKKQSHAISLDISDLQSGVYFVKVGKQMKKLVVE